MTILREAEHRALQSVELQGMVLDLGGDKRSEYQRLFKGQFTLKTANMDPATQPDVLADLEKSLAVENNSYDGVLLINVLEHIFEYRQLIAESARVLKPQGKAVIIVPFMFPYHPSPNDYHRYSKAALTKALELGGFANIEVKALGTGVLSARYIFIERLLPGAVQNAIGFFTHPLVEGFDAFLTSLARGLRKSYDPADYALGFLVTATKV